MVNSYKFRGWVVSHNPAYTEARELFEAFLEGRIPEDTVSLLADGVTGKVRKIEFRGKTYVLKHDLRRKHRFEFLVQSFFVGSNATRLLRKQERSGMAESEDCPMARVFLTADKIRCRCVLESFILMEFVEGEEVYEIPGGKERYGEECARIIRRLHASDLVHGDIHLRNFMVERGTGRIRAIDVSGKWATAYQRAFDKIRVDEYFGIRLDEKAGFWEKLVRAHLRYRAQRKAKKKKV